MNQNNKLNDEIDLRDLFFTLWGGKIYIIFFLIISVFLASFYLQSAERKYLVELLDYTNGRIGEAAQLAGLTPRALYNKMKIHGLKKEDFK